MGKRAAGLQDWLGLEVSDQERIRWLGAAGRDLSAVFRQGRL